MANMGLNKEERVPGVCRICFAPLQRTFCNLGMSPLANSYVTDAEVRAGKERFFPLHAYVCDICTLVQLEAFEQPEAIFSDYAYFSSYSSTLVEHSRAYSEMIAHRLSLIPGRSLVLEIASNDGYLLQHFANKQIRVLGVEPARNVAEVAREKGIETEVLFFGTDSAERLAGRYGYADLVIGNNVIAHVPDLHDFIGGVKIALADEGTATFEFPHLLRLIEKIQFDTIYHEHFSYFALNPLRRAFNAHGLEITDVEEIPTHGGSLRIYVQHAAKAKVQPSVGNLLGREKAANLDDPSTYGNFQAQVDRRRNDLLKFLTDAKENGISVAGYGAPAKGVTLLNYCNIDTMLLPYTVDLNPNKRDKLLPGSHIPIYDPKKILETKPDVVFILAWNLRDEIEQQLHEVRTWGGRFAVAIPQLEVR